MENKEFYNIFPELGHEVFEKPLELYSHSNVICMNSLNTVIANAIEKSKLGKLVLISMIFLVPQL
jgi:hypothetical protein